VPVCSTAQQQARRSGGGATTAIATAIAIAIATNGCTLEESDSPSVVLPQVNVTAYTDTTSSKSSYDPVGRFQRPFAFAAFAVIIIKSSCVFPITQHEIVQAAIVEAHNYVSLVQGAHCSNITVEISHNLLRDRHGFIVVRDFFFKCLNNKLQPHAGEDKLLCNRGSRSVRI
jgi:hypothetical protein